MKGCLVEPLGGVVQAAAAIAHAHTTNLAGKRMLGICTFESLRANATCAQVI